jgi:hypothetical protein
MMPADEARFAAFVSQFIDDCKIEPPFHVVIIGANGAISIQHHTDSQTEQVCSHVVEPGFTAPLTVAVIGPDGVGKSARITVEIAKPVLQ